MFAATLIVAFELDHDTRCGAAVGNVCFDRWIEIAARVVCTPADPDEGASYRKKKREDELFNKEKELRDLQKRRFGYQGDLFKEREKLVKPLQDKVYNAVQKIAVARGYDFILDKSEGITVIFADPKLDKSDDILRELGIK